MNDTKLRRAMNGILIVLAALLAFSQPPTDAHPTFGGIRLLEGYSAKRGGAVDATAWTIRAESGLRIEFEAGPNEGSWADPRDINKYAWYREQILHRFMVRFALVKPGMKTQWEPNESRGLPPGNILLVTYLLDGPKSTHTANFSAKLANSAELGDALLMIVTFDPSKGAF